MGPMPDNIGIWEIHSDQSYLYRMVRAVDRGECDANLASFKPGPVSPSRWITFAARLLRMYVTKTNPSNDLKILVQYVMKVYAPFWFLVKSQPLAIDGSRHIFQLIQWTRSFPASVKKVVEASIQINGYFCHPENILLAMLTDEDRSVRSEAYEKVLEARRHPASRIRQFLIPKINFHSTSYTTMIDWANVKNLSEPPCIQFISQKDLVDLYDSGQIIDIPGYYSLKKYKYNTASQP